jgi:transposase
MTNKNYNKIEKKLHIAFELSNKNWKLCMTDGQTFMTRDVDSENLAQLHKKIKEAQTKFKLKRGSTIVSCYEAGRDGFWLHHFLLDSGIQNIVIDSASIETNRRGRRAKTDNIDARKMATMLIRHHQGENGMWSICNVPSEVDEDQRQIHRELGRLKKDRARSMNRMSGLLKLHGLSVKPNKHFLKNLSEAKLWNGKGIGRWLKEAITREYERFVLVNSQMTSIEKYRDDLLKTAKLNQNDLQQILMLMELRGIGKRSAWIFVMEFFSWRKFKNRKQVAALAGMCPTPYDSGDSMVEQGISKAGNKRIRALAVEVAWFWLRYQPKSKLSRWYMRRFGKGNRRMRKIGIVAMARKLLIDLWKYLEFGEVPEGVVFTK